MSEPAHVLVVAHQTAAPDGLLDAVHERAERGPASVPPRRAAQPHGMHKFVDPQDVGADEAAGVLRDALPKLSEAAGQPRSPAAIGDAEPLMAIQDAINLGQFDEIIISTLPLRASRMAEARPGLQDAGARAAGHARRGARTRGGRRL